MADKKRVHAIISGRVQGVFFRMETKKQANANGVCGWVKNLPDGRVEAIFEGEKTAVDNVVAWCHQGPAAANVTDVKTSEEPVAGDCRDFQIRH